jgi:beta-galactosidase
VHLVLPEGLEELEWLGLGPHETYPDRRACGVVGRYASTVTGQYVPHIMPQEHGHHIDTRWLALRRADGAGVVVSAGGMLGFNASHCDIHELTAARHTTDVVMHREVHLHLDAAHRGLGTASCGPDAFEQYRIPSGRRYQLSYRMIPLAKDQDANDLHRS